jgi:hypothetical protein
MVRVNRDNGANLHTSRTVYRLQLTAGFAFASLHNFAVGSSRQERLVSHCFRIRKSSVSVSIKKGLDPIIVDLFANKGFLVVLHYIKPKVL